MVLNSANRGRKNLRVSNSNFTLCGPPQHTALDISDTTFNNVAERRTASPAGLVWQPFFGWPVGSQGMPRQSLHSLEDIWISTTVLTCLYFQALCEMCGFSQHALCYIIREVKDGDDSILTLATAASSFPLPGDRKGHDRMPRMVRMRLVLTQQLRGNHLGSFMRRMRK